MNSRIIKTAVGAPIAIYAAEALGLHFALASGVILILTLGPTKKGSLSLAWVRLKATALALSIGTLSFYLIGFNPLAFGIYLLAFLPLAYRFKMADGIVVNSVLVTHLWTVGSIGWYIILNSFALMAIGTAVAILLNSIMPNLLPQVLDDQEKIEARFREILTYFGDKIRHKASAINGHSLLRETGELLEAAKARADANQDNYLTRDYAYYSKYMTMRFLQFEIFLRMDKLLDEVEMTVFQTGLVADLTLALAAGLHEQNDGSGFMLNFERVLGICRLMALPSTREEFENRARLFAYLGEIRQLISIKQEFIKHVSEK